MDSIFFDLGCFLNSLALVVLRPLLHFRAFSSVQVAWLSTLECSRRTLVLLLCPYYWFNYLGNMECTTDYSMNTSSQPLSPLLILSHASPWIIT